MCLYGMHAINPNVGTLIKKPWAYNTKIVRFIVEGTLIKTQSFLIRFQIHIRNPNKDPRLRKPVPTLSPKP